MMRLLPTFLLLSFVLLIGHALGSASAWADDAPLHPPFPLKDAQGKSVLESGRPVSPIQTCAGCHDTAYIAAHSYHVDAGSSSWGKPGGAKWADGPGPFGGWDPLLYRRYSHKDGKRFDLGRAGWIRNAGKRHIGGGPAAFAADGTPLSELQAGESPNADTHVWNASTGKAEAWDWKRSGALEVDCFLCHLRAPAFGERTREVEAGRFRHAPTATLLGTGLVERDGENWRWKRAAFDEQGNADLSRLASAGHRLGAPEAANCGQCHGPAPLGRAPIMWKDLLEQANAETRGQVFSGQRLRDSALNLAGKESLHRPFDVHAERLLVCSDCHHAANNPAYEARASESRPKHLKFDARRPDLAEFLRTPNHNFARGRDGSMKNCSDFHDSEASHDWLPYAGTHMAAMRCEACHVPRVYVPARRVTDWTILSPSGGPRIEYRGVDGPIDDARSLVPGFKPLLLPRTETDGTTRLTPYNVIAFWYWVESDPERPVRLVDLQQALFVGSAYHPDVLAALDSNADGTLRPDELGLDTPAKVEAVRKRLLAVGVTAPVIAAELRPYGLHHTVATGSFATRDCSTCHTETSALASSLDVASFAPGGALPTWAGDDRVRPTGSLQTQEEGRLVYVPDLAAGGRYVLGHDRVGWIDALGIAAVVIVLLGAGTHGALRILATRRRRQA